MGSVVLLGVNFLVLLQVLWTLEGLGADAAGVVLEGDVDPDVRGDVVALGAALSARVSLSVLCSPSFFVQQVCNIPSCFAAIPVAG